jgi:hypothetical protein
MLEKIHIFLNDYPFIGIIISIIIIVLMMTYLSWNKCSTYVHENFNITTVPVTVSGLPKCDVNTDHVFYKNYNNKNVNFKCNYNGIEYYLSNVKESVCGDKQPTDCINTIIVLIPVTEIKDALNVYLKTVKVNMDKCNSNKRIDCLSALPESHSEDAVNKCNDNYKGCNVDKSYQHDFKIKLLNGLNSDTDGSIRRTYAMIGNLNDGVVNGSSRETVLNQFLYYNNGINLLCGDSFNYIKPPKYYSQSYAEVVIIETPIDVNSSIVGGSNSNIKVKIRFNTQETNVSKNEKGENIYTPVKDANGNIKMKASYVGICDNNNICKLSTEKSYPRICLYDDIMDGHVLEFEPELSNY